MIEVTSRGKMNNAFDPATVDDLDGRSRDMVHRRAELLGPAYRLFYDRPIEIIRGAGVHLYDREGNEYLDAYNNVVSVGHAHPRVVAAVHDQMQTLTTHTRYLHEGILSYAEDLLGMIGGHLRSEGRAMFTCTGSEANDLALRIAKHFTGNNGVIVTSEAYHGNSDLTAGISPSLGEYSPLGTWTRRVITPDSYRIPARSLRQRFVEDVICQIHDLQRHGDGLAAFVMDSIFSSDGIYSDPRDFMAPVIEAVHDAGGLFIADEVQSGFARTGKTFWGYERHGVDPDIVTLGKPMGNGFPVGGIVVDRRIVDRFGDDTRYFNTFGGNTVAMAAAQATLGVIREEGLQDNSERVGAFLRASLEELATAHPQIGDVRGAGLYVGVELVEDRSTARPDSKMTALVVNGLRQRRVLVSTTGRDANVIKIRPPLVFSEFDACHLVTELSAVLTEIRE